MKGKKVLRIQFYIEIGFCIKDFVHLDFLLEYDPPYYTSTYIYCHVYHGDDVHLGDIWSWRFSIAFQILVRYGISASHDLLCPVFCKASFHSSPVSSAKHPCTVHLHLEHKLCMLEVGRSHWGLVTDTLPVIPWVTQVTWEPGNNLTPRLLVHCLHSIWKSDHILPSPKKELVSSKYKTVICDQRDFQITCQTGEP